VSQHAGAATADDEYHAALETGTNENEEVEAALFSTRQLKPF
jgi:hypothetical protein